MSFSGDPRIAEIRRLLPRAMLHDWVRLGSRLVRLLKDHHHPARHEAVLERIYTQALESVDLRGRRGANVPAIHYTGELPIVARKDEIVQGIRTNQVLVIAGETGSGKTTQIPKMCLEAGLGIEAKIGCTQPRRVAALSISRRIAEELNLGWGREVGCKIRFDDRSSPETYIKLMTDGILLAETQTDPLLSDYNAIIIDEAHERSLNIDFLLGYLKGLLAKRPELKLVITSATIDTKAFSEAFGNAPVIEVSGRVYPVEVAYAPLDPASEESGEMTYIDGAVRATEDAICSAGSGDILIFMPGERDIKETTDILRARFGDAAEIIPLFGRLSSGDQQRVFQPAAQRKIIVATNIAETSLTIPGIRYVIDSGLARISRYNPRTRTKRLPVEPISQSSANQRKGRSGRVQNGFCIRLFSEADFASRPEFTQPEIQRANLAEVILRMKAFRLGEIETFPFINPPPPSAIQGGYALLQELGALDDERGLTRLGWDLARLPIDPTLGRMLLQAQAEHATSELLIIASGLSIQDPRERPLEQKDAAAAAHKRFQDPKSDFLTLLNIWNAVHEQWETLRTQNQRRKFCRANFLSYLRMREWQDLYAQLHDALDELGTLRLNESNADYDAIHRSILTGLLAHVAKRSERNLYRASANRQVSLFPGSALYDRGQKAKQPKQAPQSKEQLPVSVSQPEWIVAGEIYETSQVFARTAAGIDPLWIPQLAPHICKVVYQNPRWDAKAGRVIADEKTTLFGLEVRNRMAAYGNVNAKEATAIFIRSALVEEGLFPEADPADTNPRAPRWPAFLLHNRQLREKIQIWQTRMRHHALPDLDQALLDFYGRRLENISSLDELNRLLRDKDAAQGLCARESDLMEGEELAGNLEAFPDTVSLDGHDVEVRYHYEPGGERDGVTLKLASGLAQTVPGASIEWAVPGLRESQIEELLRALPKSLRRELMPLKPKAVEIARALQPSGQSLTQDLAGFIFRNYGIKIPGSAWPADALPAHLRPRMEVLGYDLKTVIAGRDLDELRKRLVESKPGPDPTAWVRAAQKWEQFGLTRWSVGDLPERITVVEDPAVFAWPGLAVEDAHVNLRLFRDAASSRSAGKKGVVALLSLAMEKDLGWLQKDLRALSRFAPLCAGFCTIEELEAGAYLHLKRHLFPIGPAPILTLAGFQSALEEARRRLPGLCSRFMDLLEPVLKLRQEAARRFTPAALPAKSPGSRLTSLSQLGAPSPAPAQPRPSSATSDVFAKLQALAPKNFLEVIPFEKLPEIPRYLKALLIRGERAALNPVKDRERAAQIAPYDAAWQELSAVSNRSEEARQVIEEFRWMLEEFRISVFAQELGTAFPISTKRLDQHLEKTRSF